VVLIVYMLIIKFLEIPILPVVHRVRGHVRLRIISGLNVLFDTIY